MKSAISALFLGSVLAGSLFAQTAPDNAAQDSLQKRLDQLKLVDPPKPLVPPQVVTIVTAPKVCAIPLLNAVPPQSRPVEAMPRVRPPAVREPEAPVPAPPCN